MRILALTYGAPWVPDRGARVRDRELLVRLGAHHEVTVLALSHDDPPPAGDRLAPVARAESVRLGRLPDPFAARSLAAAPFASRGAAARIAAAGSFDAVQVEHSFLAPLARFANARRSVLSLHNVATAQYASMATASATRRTAAQYRVKSALIAGLERRHLPRFDRVVVVSEDERAVLRARFGEIDPVVVPNGARLPVPAPEPEDDVLLFVGSMDYAPNAEAARRLACAIAPRVPGAETWIAGRCPPSGLGAARVLGAVDDLTDAYAGARVVVVPLRAGGGTRLKVLEALAHGRPVVSTPLGCAGLGVRDGEEVLLAQDDAGLASATRRLLGDPALRARLRENGRRFVQRDHDWDRCAEPLLAMYSELER